MQFYNYPHTDLNQQNLSWIINELKDIEQRITTGDVIKVVSTAAEMTDPNVIYVYTGHEAGYTTNGWYYWDSSANAWTYGGMWGYDSSTPLPVANGGTGSTTASAARTALGITPANIGAVATSALPLSLANGGTGATSASAARTALGLGSVATESTVPLSKGGTGATSASAARSALGLGDLAVENGPLAVGKGGTGETTVTGIKTALGLPYISTNKFTAAASGGSASIPVANNERGLFISSGVSTGAQELILYAVRSTGTMTYTKVVGTADLVIDTSVTNTFKITNNSGGSAAILQIAFPS